VIQKSVSLKYEPVCTPMVDFVASTSSPRSDPLDISCVPAVLHRNVQRFRGGLVCKAHRLCVSLNSRLERNEEERREAAVVAFLAVSALREHIIAQVRTPPRKVDVRLPGKGNSNSHGARPVYLIITMI